MASGLTQRQDLILTKDETPNRPGQKSPSSPEAELVQRVVATPAFTRSVLLTRFLLYICDRKLCGREEEITEYRIGVQALGRPSAYNPGEDNIVRNYARILRRRLEEYFAGDGRDEQVRIVIPVGHYVPVFEPNRHMPDVLDAEVEDQVDPKLVQNPGMVSVVARKTVWQRLRRLWIPAAALLVLSIGVGTYVRVHARSTRINDVFWRQIFDRSRTTYLVPGDSGLAMMQEITGKEVHLSDYIAGDLDEKFHDFNLAAERGGIEYGFDRVSHYTSKADLSIAVGVAGIAQHYNGQLVVRDARSMNLENFRGSNVILVGGPRANPWVELIEPQSNFVMYFPMHSDGIHFDERTFINKKPRAGEQRAYTSETDDTTHRTYALLSFLPEADGTGHALLLEGEGMAGTQAAGDFLLDQRAMEPILKRAQLSDGSIGPFEILLEARTVGENAPGAHVVVERFGTAKSTE